MENKTVIVDKDSFGYKFLRQNYHDGRDMPRSECSYFWSLVFAFILYPFWKPVTMVDNRDSIKGNSFTGFIIYFALFIFGGGLYGLVDILLLGSEFNGDNGFHILSMAILVLVLFLCIIGIIALFKYIVNQLKTKFKNNNMTLSDDETGFSLFENIKNFKRKICRPIEYRESEKNV